MTCIDGNGSSLFDLAELSERARLISSPFGGLLPGEKVVDLFCGGGGWTASEELHRAGYRVDYAVNHSPLAIEWHKANNPECVHVQGDAWKAKPRDVMGDELLGHLLASAACTSHSNARGAAPISLRVHMMGWCIARWIKEKMPRLVDVENVVEWQKWGPLIPLRHPNGRVMRDPKTHKVLRIADKKREGQHFRRWIRYCRKLGYQVEFRVFDAADVGNASRRKRLFVKMRRDGLPIVWPERTHGETGLLTGVAGGALQPYRAAADIIDWSDLGRSIFEGPRNKKSYGGTRLAKKTLGRACEGIARFVLEDPKPFTLRVTHAEGKGWKVSSIDTSLPTQTGRQDLALVAPMVAKTCMHGGSCCSSIEEAVPTQTTCQDTAMLGCVIAPQNTGVYGQRPDAPGPAITTKGHQSLVAAALMNNTSGHSGGRLGDPGPTVTTGGQAGLVSTVVMPAGGPECNPTPVSDLSGTVLTRDHRGIGSAVLFGAGGSGYAGKPAPVDQLKKTVMCEDRSALGVPVMMAQRNNAVGSSPRDPAPGICASSQHNCVGTPVMATVGWGERAGQAPRCNSVRDVVQTIPAEGVKQGVVVPAMSTFYGTGTNVGDVRDSLRGVTTRDRHGITAPVLGPMAPGMRARAVKIGRLLRRFLGDRVRLNAEGMALAIVEGIEYVIVDILFRMLRPHELAAAMGFPPGYQFPKVQRDAVRLIGNAVAVPMAEALIFASLPRMRPSRKKVAA